MIEVPPSILAEELIRIGGEPPDYSSFKPARFVIDAPKKYLLLKCGRQVGKSSIVATIMLLDAKFRNGFRQGYIAPNARASTSFSVLRFSDVLINSTALWPNFYSLKNTDKFVIDNVGLKKFKNNSVCVFLYADSDPDRIRGFTFDRIVFDEVQDIDLDAVVPVVEACIMNSPYAEEMFLGTPKSLDNQIELLWSNSKQYEWTVKCEGCGKHNIFVSTKTIGKNGPICAHCGKALNTANGYFVAMQPSKEIDGVHIARTALPFYIYHPEAWQKIVSLMNDPLWSKEKFENEILGISSGAGMKMITEKDLIEISTYDVDPLNKASYNRGVERFIGIDWGGSDYSMKTETVQSRTALVVYVLEGSKLNIAYYSVFDGMGPVDILEEIKRIIIDARPTAVAADAAGGKVENSELLKLCVSSRIHFYPIQWGSYSKPLEWNKVSMYLADKTTMFDDFFMEILRKGLIALPKRNNQQLIAEFLAEHAEISTSASGRKIWKRIPNKTDDLLHAAVFGWVGFKAVKGYEFSSLIGEPITP